MTDDLRRRDDGLLVALDKRLALLEQAATLNSQTAAARSAAHDAAIETLSAKLDAALGLWHSVSAEPSASPAGRAVMADLEEIKSKVDEHERFVVELAGALRLARLAFGTSLLSAVTSLLVILDLVSGSH